MGIDFDELEKAIIQCIKEHPGLGFNDLLRELESRKVEASRSGLSRRLKRLVGLGILSKDVKPGWPPSTKYRTAHSHGHWAKIPGRLGASPKTVTPMLVLSLASTVVCLLEYAMITDLRSEVAAKDQLLEEKSRHLESLASVIKRLEESGVDPQSILRLNLTTQDRLVLIPVVKSTQTKDDSRSVRLYFPVGLLQSFDPLMNEGWGVGSSDG